MPSLPDLWEHESVNVTLQGRARQNPPRRSISEDRAGQGRAVVQSCPTLCNPMDCSTPGLPVHHQLPEFTQTHVHRVGDSIQPSHPLSSPSPPAFNLSQHQGLFQRVSSHQHTAQAFREVSINMCLSACGCPLVSALFVGKTTLSLGLASAPG